MITEEIVPFLKQTICFFSLKKKRGNILFAINEAFLLQNRIISGMGKF